MKVNKLICSIAILAIAMINSVGNAQSQTRPTSLGGNIGAAVPQPVVGEHQGSMVVSQQIMPARPQFEPISEIVDSSYMPAPIIQACDCHQASCTTCQPRRQRPACGCQRLGCRGGCEVAQPAPTGTFQSCEGDFCKLSIKKGKEKVTCFTTEQETVCIPAVRLPWQKSCPPSKSRTRIVTRLKTEKKEVESCSYKWTVDETNDCGCESSDQAEPTKAQEAEKMIEVEGTVEPEPAVKPEAAKEAFEENIVPPAPKVKGAFLRAFQKRR